VRGGNDDNEKFVFPEAFVMNESMLITLEPPINALSALPAFCYPQKPLDDPFTPPFLFVLLL
jgi:hypothetical protein